MKNKLLETEGKELSQLLGEVLQTKPYEHNTYMTRVGLPPIKNVGYKCIKCGEFQELEDWENNETPCTLPDPIPLDKWDVVMKWRNWLKDNFTFEQITSVMITIFAIGVDDDTARINELAPENMKHQAHYWFAIYAEEKDWLRLVALCKFNKEQNSK